MGSIRKTFHDDIYVIGDIIGQALNVTSAIISTTLYVAGNTTIGATPTNTTTLTVYGMISIPEGGFTTGLVMEKALDIDIGANTEFDINDDLFRFTDGTNLLRIDSLNGVQINGDIKMAIGDTLYVDNILRRDTGLGTLDVEGTSFDGGIFYCDFIAEKTGGNGIRIDLLKILDNTIDLISGTEIIIEENVRIRDGKALEVSAIYEADLSSDVTIYSRTNINSAFTANFAVTFANITAPSNHQALFVNDSGQVSTLALVTALTTPNPDTLFINGNVQLNSGPGTGGRIDLTNTFGSINNEIDTIASLTTTPQLIIGSIFEQRALLISAYSNNWDGSGAGSGLLAIAYVVYSTYSGDNNVRVEFSYLHQDGLVLSYTGSTPTDVDINIASTAGTKIDVVWSYLRIG